MARTKYKKSDKTKDQKKHFPLWKDSIYQSLTVEHQNFVYNIFLQPLTGWKNYQCFQRATSRKIKKSTANTYTSELLKNPKIVHCIDKVKKHYRRQLRITPERILKEEASIAFSDIVEFFDDDGDAVNFLACGTGAAPDPQVGRARPTGLGAAEGSRGPPGRGPESPEVGQDRPSSATTTVSGHDP